MAEETYTLVKIIGIDERNWGTFAHPGSMQEDVDKLKTILTVGGHVRDFVEDPISRTEFYALNSKIRLGKEYDKESNRT